MRIFIQAPESWSSDRVEKAFSDVVDISPFPMYDLTKKSLTGHIQRQQLKEVVAFVFQEDAMLFSLFRGIHQDPAFFHRLCGRHLYRYMLAMLHGVNSHGRMPSPG